MTLEYNVKRPLQIVTASKNFLQIFKQIFVENYSLYI